MTEGKGYDVRITSAHVLVLQLVLLLLFLPDFQVPVNNEMLGDGKEIQARISSNGSILKVPEAIGS